LQLLKEKLLYAVHINHQEDDMAFDTFVCNHSKHLYKPTASSMNGPDSRLRTASSMNGPDSRLHGVHDAWMQGVLQ